MSPIWRTYAAMLITVMWLRGVAGAHEVRPAYVEITEDATRDVHVVWKQPTTGQLVVPLSPVLSSGWLQADASSQTVSDSLLIRQWRISAPHAPLHGQTLTIQGLDKTVTDVLARVTFSNGATINKLIKPDHAVIELLQPGRSTLPVIEYLELGLMHIWLGMDHLLYVFGLMLLVQGTRTLLKTITAFTVAHSITLAAAALHFVDVPAAQIEVVIALSIVCVAVELVHLRRGEGGLGSRWPWLIAFTFGLLHGFAFAGGLAEIGLPSDAIPTALLLFNLGIEAGQLVFVGTMLLALGSLERITPASADWVPRLSPYVIGSLAAMWCIERTMRVF